MRVNVHHMTDQPMKIWCNADFPEPLALKLQQALAPNALIWSSRLHKSNLAAGGPDPEARSADIIYGQPDPEDLIHSTTLKWVHLTTAGYTRYDNDAVRTGVAEIARTRF